MLYNRVKILNKEILGSKYIIYVLSTPDKNWTVERNESDFVNLRESLKRNFPGYSIPLLPKKSYKKINDEILDKYKTKFQQFLEEILRRKELREYRTFISFISERIFENYNNSINIQNDNSADNINSFIEIRCDKLYSNLKSVRNSFEK